MKKKIGIIMPCYYSSDVIRQALTMLSWQTRKDAIEVIMINDCSPNTDCKYADLLEEFSDKINIRYFETEKNSGPGISRQLGMDNCSAQWVMFHDDDDMLNNPYVIEEYLNIIDSIPQNIIVGRILAPILRYQNSFPYFVKDNWTSLGNLYNLNLIKKFNLRYTDLTYEEDTLFGTQFSYYLNKENGDKNSPQIILFDIHTIQPDFIAYTKKDNVLSICSTLDECKRSQKALKFLEYLFGFYSSLPRDEIFEDFMKNNLKSGYDYLLNWAKRTQPFELTNEQKESALKVYNDFIMLKQIFPNMFSLEEIDNLNSFYKNII